MTRFAAAGLALALAGVASAEETVLHKLGGTYKVLSVEKGGKAGPKDVTSWTVTFALEEMTVTTPDGTKKATIKLDLPSDPVRIDITPADGPEKGKTFRGLYKLEKGELTLAFTEGGDRPKGLTSENGATLVKMKKEAK